MRVIGFCICFTIVNQANTQIWSDQIFLDTIHTLMKEKQYDCYFKIVKDQSKALAKNGNIEKFNDLDSLFRLDDLLKIGIDKSTLREAYMFRGWMHRKYLADLNGALEYYLIAHQLLDPRLKGDRTTWTIENSTGVIYTQLGDYDKAEYFFKKTEKYLKATKDSSKLSRLYTNMGRSYSSQYKRDKAIESFERGLALTNSNVSKVANRLNLFELYIEMGDKIKAAEILNTLNLNKSDELQNRQYHFLRLKGAYYGLLKEYEKATKYLKESIDIKKNEIVASADRLLAKDYNLLAEIYLQSGQFDLAEKSVQKGLHALAPSVDTTNVFLTSKSHLYPENTFMELLTTKADIIITSNDKSRYWLASESLEFAMHVADLLRNPYVSESSNLINIQANRELINKAIELEFLKQNSNDPDYSLNNVKRYFKESKNNYLEDQIQRKDQIANLEEKERYEAEMLMDSITHWNNLKQVNSSLDKIDSIDILITQSQTRLAQLLPKLFITDFAENVLIPNSIEYVLTNNNLFCLANIDNKSHFRKMGSSETLSQLVNKQREYILTQIDEKELLKIGKELYYLLIPKDFVLPTSIRFIPDDILHFLNFELLSKDGKEYLLQNHVVSYSNQNRLQLKNPEASRQEIFCLAPSYKNTVSSASAELIRGELYGLEHNDDEIEKILSIWEGDNETFKSKDDIFEKIHESSIFHFAGHAIVEESSAFLALDDADKLDSKLFTHEIEAQNLNCDLVCLSACETGLGKIETGEGIFSLTRSFIQAGAKAICSTLWTVNDESTAKLMQTFHQNLKEGLPKDQALRQAKLSYIQQAPPEQRHPYFWAGFTLTGSTHALNTKSNVYPYIAAITIGLLCIIFLIIKMKST